MSSWKESLIVMPTPLRFDLDPIVSSFREDVLHRLPAVWRNTYNPKDQSFKYAMPDDPAVEKRWGGWAVQSPDGDYRSGWLPRNRENRDGAICFKQGRLDDPNTRHVLPTQACTAPIARLLDRLIEIGLKPCRTKIACLAASQFTEWHNDTPTPDTLSLRMHLPLITNEDCFLEGAERRYSMAADGSTYLLNNNVRHRAVNFGGSHRYHLIVDFENMSDVPRILGFPAP